MRSQIIKKYIFFIIILLLSQNVFSLDFIPASVEPGRVAQEITATTPQLKKPVTPRVAAPEAASALPEEVLKIKLKINGFILKGNTLYTDQELLALFPYKLGTTVTLKDIEQFVNAITLKYNKAGYLLSRAIIPAQTIKGGIVEITIIEGYIDEVSVEGESNEVIKSKIKRYGDKVVQKKPLNVNDLESALLLANDLPGIQVQSVITPSKTTPAAASLVLVVTHKVIDESSYISYDNRGTRYIGPTRTIGSVFLNTMLGAGASTGIRVADSGQWQEMRYIEFEHKQYVGTNGLMFDLDGQYTRTEPGFLLEGTDTIGRNKYGTLSAQYPLIRQRSLNLSLTGGFTYINSLMNQFDFKVYNDQIRTFQLGFLSDFMDRFNGSNQLSGYFTQGLDILGASQPDNLVSRFGAQPTFAKINLSGGRLQGIFRNLSLLVTANGQYSFSKMYAYEQIGYGGLPFGDAYDPSEIVGDRGVEAKIEFHLDTFFPIKSIPTQYYTYCDGGMMWNIDHIFQEGRATGTSAGFGFRSSLFKFINVSLELAKPLDRDVATVADDPSGGNPKAWRGFFSIIAFA
jgi:hemolysin activation/secretion protein